VLKVPVPVDALTLAMRATAGCGLAMVLWLQLLKQRAGYRVRVQ
jgi:hypothetical protein